MSGGQVSGCVVDRLVGALWNGELVSCGMVSWCVVEWLIGVIWNCCFVRRGRVCFIYEEWSKSEAILYVRHINTT